MANHAYKRCTKVFQQIQPGECKTKPAGRKVRISSTYAGFGQEQVHDAIEQHGNRIMGAAKIKPAAESIDIKLSLLAEPIKGFPVHTLGLSPNRRQEFFCFPWLLSVL